MKHTRAVLVCLAVRRKIVLNWRIRIQKLFQLKYFSSLNTAVCRMHQDEVTYLFYGVCKIKNCNVTTTEQGKLCFSAAQPDYRAASLLRL